MGQFDNIEIEDISLLIDTVTYTNGDGYGWIYEGHVDQETRQPSGIGIQVSNDGDTHKFNKYMYIWGTLEEW